MQFANGKVMWHGCEIDAEIGNNVGVKMVTFGEHFNSYFALYEDGSLPFISDVLPTSEKLALCCNIRL